MRRPETWHRDRSPNRMFHLPSPFSLFAGGILGGGRRGIALLRFGEPFARDHHVDDQSEADQSHDDVHSDLELPVREEVTDLDVVPLVVEAVGAAVGVLVVELADGVEAPPLERGLEAEPPDVDRRGARAPRPAARRAPPRR